MKSWYLMNSFPYAGSRGLIKESHFVCLQSSSEMQSGARATGGQHFGGVHFFGPSEKIAFEKLPGVTPLGHVHADAGKPLPPEVVDALSAYGVTAGDCVRGAVQKVIAKTANWPMALGEL